MRREYILQIGFTYFYSIAIISQSRSEEFEVLNCLIQAVCNVVSTECCRYLLIFNIFILSPIEYSIVVCSGLWAYQILLENNLIVKIKVQRLVEIWFTLMF